MAAQPAQRHAAVALDAGWAGQREMKTVAFTRMETAPPRNTRPSRPSTTTSTTPAATATPGSATATTPHYQACVDFCQKWDQASFDPAYDTLPLAHFEPMLRRVLATPRKAHA